MESGRAGTKGLKVKRRAYGRRRRYYLSLLRRLAAGVLFLGVGFGLISGGLRAWEYVRGLECFRVSRIVVRGNRRLGKAEICRAAGVRKGQSIFEIEPGEAAQRVRALAYVQWADVERVLPDGILVEVRERRPVAMAVAGERWFLVDGEGVVLECGQVVCGGGHKAGAGYAVDCLIQSCAAAEELPVILGPEAADLALGRISSSSRLRLGLRLLAELRSAGMLRRGCLLDVSEPMMPVFCTASGRVRLRLGLADVRRQIERLQAVWQSLNARIQEVEYLDLRFKDMVVVKFQQPVVRQP